MEIKLPPEVEYIISALEKSGHRADIVGGPVRDFILGKRPSDYDITTDATPDEVKAVFSSERTVDTGIKHGTVSLILSGVAYEITTYRIDGEYKDSRHPESVDFTKDLLLDLSRRDFTMNAVCYSPKNGFTDPFGGIEDTRCGVIRAVGEAQKRFTEDALRILRCIRFASCLGFKVEERTAAAAKKCALLLLNVSGERIGVELRKLIAGAYSHEVIEEFSDILKVVLPELSFSSLPRKELFEKASPDIRLFSLFALSTDKTGEKFAHAMERIRSDKKIRDTGIRVLSALEDASFSDERSAAGVLLKYGKDDSQRILALKVLLGKAADNEADILASLLSSGRPYALSSLSVNGRDLIQIGISGKRVGELLSQLLFHALCAEVENEREPLILLAKKLNK